MTFADIASKRATNIQAFAVVQVYNRDTAATTTFYWSEGDTHTDQVDGTVRDWEGRLDGWRQEDHDQTIGSSRYAHPSASINVYLGNVDGDEADDLWDYLDDDHQWEGQSFKLYAVDMSQAGGAGAEIIFHGKIGARPGNLSEGEHFVLKGVGRHQDERVPNGKMSMPSKYRAGFVQPVIWSGPNAVLTAAVNATQTTFTVTSTATIFQGQLALICDLGASTNPEYLYIDSVTDATHFEANRGFGGSTAAAHSIGDFVYGMNPGPSQLSRGNTDSENVLPIVGGTGSADRGAHDVSGYIVGRGRRVAAACNVEAWASSGKGPRVQEEWNNNGGTIQVLTPGANTLNDWDDVNGTPLAWGGAIVAATNYHLQPHPWPAGTYWYTGVPLADYAAADVNIWARIRGITRDDTETGVRCQNATDWIKYLMENSYAGLGYTLSDVVDSTQISGWGAGAFDAEYTESWFDELAWTAPRFGATESPYALDVLQEACDCSNADLFVRGGKLWPKRRTVEATADLTVKDYHLVGSRPVKLDDPQGMYCNVLVTKASVQLWCEPDAVNDIEPVRIPMTSILGDDDEIARYGDVIEANLSRSWHYFNLFTDWVQGTEPSAVSLQTEHMQTWNVAHKEQLDMRAQPQTYIRATLQENCTWIQQGHTIAYDVPGITTRKGQVRGVARSRSAANGGPRPPIKTEVLSWHIEF